MRQEGVTEALKAADQMEGYAGGTASTAGRKKSSCMNLYTTRDLVCDALTASLVSLPRGHFTLLE